MIDPAWDAPPFLARAADELRALQDRICTALSAVDGQDFRSDPWQRAEGGGGLSRVLEEGGQFEKAAVLYSGIRGTSLPDTVLREYPQLRAGTPYYAAGVSLICHPRNPYVPTVHFNVRAFEVGPVHWFGGGMDLTPYYPFAEDCRHFHTVIKACCDRFSRDYYPQYKAWCDRYFYLKHRREARGIGGIFFNYLQIEPEQGLRFLLELGAAFADAYVPITKRRRDTPYGQRERDFQLHRRGRYVEFNLLYDQGTLFGLQSGGRIESILASLPPQAAWHYDWQPQPGSAEERLTREYLVPRDWAGSER